MSQYSNKEAVEELDDDSDDEDFKPEGEESDNDTSLKLEREENDLDTNDTLVFSKKRRSGTVNTTNKKSKITQSPDNSEKTQTKITNDNVKSKVEDIWEQMKSETQPLSKTQPTSSTQTNIITPSNASQPGVASTAPKVKTITQTYDFAGETVKVTKPVSTSTQAKGKPKGNLDDLLGSIKKKKMSTMEKSQLDWQKFKTNEGLEDELKQATKGGGYLDKQAFLQRTEWRQFEKERDVRIARINKKPQ